MNKKPNILFFMTDQQHADSLSFMNHPTVKTPNLDKLVERGAYANNMFSCSAICTPSRTSFHTGMYVRSHGLFFNNAPMSQPFPSLPEELKRAGYRTGITGKSHLPKQIERHYDVCNDMHQYQTELAEKGYNYKEYDDLTTKEFQAKCSEIPEALQNEIWTADRSIEFIQDSSHSEDPFFLWCSFDRPHCPHTPPASFDNLYNPDEIPLDWEGYKAFENSLMQNRPMIEDFWKIGSVRHKPELFQKAVCRYFALITLIDREIGRILEALETSGELDNTIIIFTSDHGDFAGHYGQLGKNLPAYDDLIRIPFIYVDPARKSDAGRCLERLMQSVDLFPTLLERLGLEIPPTVQGQSFEPLLNGEPVEHREFIFTETSMVKTIRSKQWKLNFFVNHPEQGQLFKMSPEINEITNYWNEPQYDHIRERLIRELTAWIIRCEQPSSMDAKWEHYTDTRWYQFLREQPMSRVGLEDFREWIDARN